MLRSFKPPSVHRRESIPSKHWCHATHRLPGASPKKINCCKVAASSNTNSPGLFPLPQKELTPLRQFCTHGCCEWVHAVWWTWRCNRPRRGPRGPPPARLFRLNAVEPRRCRRWSESWLHPSYTFCWGDSTSQPLEKIPFCWGHSLAWVLNKERNGTWDVYNSSKPTKKQNTIGIIITFLLGDP